MSTFGELDNKAQEAVNRSKAAQKQGEKAAEEVAKKQKAQAR